MRCESLASPPTPETPLSREPIIAEQPGCCSSSVEHIVSLLPACCPVAGTSEPYLPLLHILLFAVVLLHQVLQDLLEAIRVCLQGRDHILHRPLNQNSIYHPEAFSVAGERLKSLEDESAGTQAVSRHSSGVLTT